MERSCQRLGIGIRDLTVTTKTRADVVATWVSRGVAGVATPADRTIVPFTVRSRTLSVVAEAHESTGFYGQRDVCVRERTNGLSPCLDGNSGHAPVLGRLPNQVDHGRCGGIPPRRASAGRARSRVPRRGRRGAARPDHLRHDSELAIAPEIAVRERSVTRGCRYRRSAAVVPCFTGENI